MQNYNIYADITTIPYIITPQVHKKESPASQTLYIMLTKGKCICFNK